ncbi:EscT/YscT/HrcT family type III secretion system export apparatus protein [Bradyrhizobium centrolobii]|uniref:Translocation protein n=2 Tax=Bradyrhizobium TaxID=374 RepID=A0A176Z014_9BRAD|nr:MULTISPECIES: type III secretion system export apparatus subunit SctT [Bradyrhizobium]OAF03751.1 EscT/YscT/HrcT family type III secretion system export apparatus protein [Bradyrhizobium centrolobii]OAF12490.1 translocation protein [Bradyrhizobium neotropicale]
MSPAETQGLTHGAIELLIAAGLGAARAVGIMLVLPVFSRPHISGLIRGCFAIAIVLPYVAQISAGLQALDSDTRLIRVALLGFKEVLVGLLLGILLSIPLWSIQAVGDTIDMQRGITSQVASNDPATHSQASATGLLLGITADTIFVLSGGLQTMISALYGSYLIWPIYRMLPGLTVQGAIEFLEVLDHIMHTTLLVSGPVLAFLLLIDISVMMLGRFAPQIKLNDLGPNIKNIAFGIIMVSYTVYLIEYMKSEIILSDGVVEWFEKLLK